MMSMTGAFIVYYLGIPMLEYISGYLETYMDLNELIEEMKRGNVENIKVIREVK